MRTHLELAALRREWATELERRVKERTAELVQTSQDLAAEILERKDAERKLRDTQQAAMDQERLRALGQMASGIAHDINNAISPVALYTESLLENEPNLSERTRSYLETTQRAIEDVAETIARTRELYRKREPQTTLVPVKVNALLQQVVELTRARWRDMPQRRGHVIDIVTQPAPDLPLILGIESEIREALTNLIFNAVDAMPKGGILSLRTELTKASASLQGDEPEHVIIEVADNGSGMDEETLRRCLEPFFTTKGEHGTGLGLAMVHGMADRHGARVGIDSTLGHGTTIRLSFAVPGCAVAEIPASVAPRATASLRILIVDDDPMVLQSLRDALEQDGHVVATAGSGEAGIEAFSKAHAGDEPFSLVVTDLGMPHMDGRGVANAVKRLSPPTPVILLTGWARQLLGEEDDLANVTRVLSKPPKLRELREALAYCCPSQAIS